MKIEIKDYEEKMKKSVAGLENEYKTISAGRASASVLDRVQVEYFGSNMPVNQVAEIKMPDPRSLVITPWDASTVKDPSTWIEGTNICACKNENCKGIRMSGTNEDGTEKGKIPPF